MLLSPIDCPVSDPQMGKPIALQFVFRPTRSAIRGITLAPTPKDPKSLNGVKIEKYLITIPYDGDQWINGAAMQKATVQVNYDGEPLSKPNSVLVYDKKDILTQDDVINKWMAARAKSAAGDPEKEFFLAIDQWTFDAQGQEERGKTLSKIEANLRRRGGQRSRGVELLIPIHDEDVGLFSKVADLLQGLLLRHFNDQIPAETKACTRFAAGLLKQSKILMAKELPEFSAGDADSAYIFYFAEFAAAMIDLGTLRKVDPKTRQFWSDRLNMFARMQAIFMERWKNSLPIKFDKIGSTAEPLPGVPSDLMKPYDEAHSIKEVASLMVNESAKMDWSH